MLCANFGGNWPSGSGEDENVKSLQQQGQWKNCYQKTLLEPSAQVT